MVYDATKKHAGVLLHISSLPSAGYIGDLGKSAYQMVNVLASMGISVWQTLPMNMPHADWSPYQCISAFAGNTEFISLESMVDDKLLSKTEVDTYYQGHIQDKSILFPQAYQAFLYHHDQSHFKRFCESEAFWLDDYALFVVLRQKFQQKSWQEWPEEYKNRDIETLNAVKQTLSDDIEVIKFAQYVFFTQWQFFKQYAADKNIALFGDIPIFVAYDSAEVWSNPHLFKLDENKNMTVVAGVPPDYFSETGQRWGNPHYDWDTMEQDNYAWWVARLKLQNKLFDLVRIDHFRGLEAAWEIDASEETAINGVWEKGPENGLLDAITQALPDLHLVAEDLGIITPEVDALRTAYNMPGMKILQFAFGGDDQNPYLPENIEANSVVYSGTHDNDTTLGWYHQAEPHVKKHFHEYIDDEKPDMPGKLIAMAMRSKGNLAIVPMQDILGLDTDARMNTPGTIEGNWHWRFTWSQLNMQQILDIKSLVAETGRVS